MTELDNYAFTVTQNTPEFREVVPGLQVARGVLSVAFAQALHQELEAIPEDMWEQRDTAGIYKIGQFRHVGSRLINAEFNPGTKFKYAPLLGKVANLPIFSDRGHVIVNKQLPGSMQNLHEDRRWLMPVDVLHVSPGGELGYLDTTIEGPDKERMLRTTHGDVVRITDNSLAHRGRNPSRWTRFTMLAYDHL